MAVDHKIQYSISSDSGATSISGYDNETGNIEPGNLTQNFSAGSSNVSVSLALTQANLQDVFLVADKGGTLITNGTGSADVQTISISGTPTGGYFSLTFGGVSTILPYNASAAQVQTALQGLSSIGSGNVTCTGGSLPGTPVVVTFAGTLATGLKSLLTAYSGSLTGGSSPTVSVAHTTLGLPQDTIVLSPGIPLVWGKSTGYGSCPFVGNVTSAYFSCTYACRLQARILSL